MAIDPDTAIDPSIYPAWREVDALVATRDLLYRLSHFKRSKNVPPWVRHEARALLRWLPPEPALRAQLHEALRPERPGLGLGSLDS